MARRRSTLPVRRTTVPQMYLELLGAKIRNVLQNEHVVHWGRLKKRRKFTIERACRRTSIPYQTMNAYMTGKRQPSILDLRDIAQFAGVTMEEIMSVIPSRGELDIIKDEEIARLAEKAREASGKDDEDDDDEDMDEEDWPD